MFDSITAAVTAARTPAERLAAQARLENAACAARLSSMADMLERAYEQSGSADREHWRSDNWAATCAQIGAAQSITSWLASSLLTHAVMLRERLPHVAAVFAEGLISYLLIRTICKKTALVKDPDARRALDAELAAELRDWGVKSMSQTDMIIDALVLRHDPYAVRRGEEKVQTCRADVSYDGEVAHLSATLNATDGRAIDARMDALARTVCERDPRTHDQRRAAAHGAMGFGWDRLPCMCEQPDCEAAAKPAVGGIFIHVVAPGEALDIRESEPPPPPGDPGPGPDAEPPPDPDADTAGVDDEAAEFDCGSDEYRELERAERIEHSDGAGACAESDCTPPDPDEPEPPRTGELTAQRRALVGAKSALLSRPLREYTIAELIAELNADPGERCPARPGVILGGSVLPGPVIAQLAMHATIRPLIHPGQAPPEPRYRPSRALAEWVRARDLTCRHPGCRRPATVCQIDHVIAWPYGPTYASNLACLCTEHHLLKTFWPGWSYRLDPDGTAHWTDPDGLSYTTHPGSRALFPELGRPTAPTVVTGTPPPKHTAGLTMPKRRVTRATARQRAIDQERQRNAEWAEQHLREQIPPF